MRVLICDDVMAKIDRIRQCLKEHGVKQVEHVQSKNALFKKMKENEYSLIILDMSLGLDGNNGSRDSLGGKEILYQLCDKGYDTPVVVVTAYSSFSPENNSILPREIKHNSKLYNNLEYKNSEVDLLAPDEGEDIYTIEGLHNYMSKHYSVYMAMIYMNPSDGYWKEVLKGLIDKLEK